MKTRAVFCLASLNFPGREKTYSCFVAWGCKLTYSGPLGYYFHRFPGIPLSNIFQKAKLWIRKEKNWSEHVAILEMLSSLSSQVSGKLGKHGSINGQQSCRCGFSVWARRWQMSLGSICGHSIASHKAINETAKWHFKCDVGQGWGR